MPHLGVVSLGMGIAAALAASAQAGFTNPLIPAWAGGPFTQSAGWESFTQPSGGPNVPDQAGSAPFSLMNYAPGAFITGTGNLYGSGAPLFISMMGGTLGNAASPVDVVLNVSTAGSTLNMSSVRLWLFDGSGNVSFSSPTLSEVRYDEPSAPQGSAQNVAFTWSVAPTSFAASGWRIEFSASAANMSLDAVRVDFQYVPAPGALALLGIASAAGGAGRRRRR
jgi:hypothetical protein